MDEQKNSHDNKEKADSYAGSRDEFVRLLEIMRRLRGKNGCPWDMVQTHESLRDNVLEEAYEAADAIDRKDMHNLCEELGDIMMLVVMQVLIAEEKGEFTMEDVLKGISDKMIYRHPHVFGDVSAEDAQTVVQKWEELKSEEKHEKTVGESMERVAKSLPANIRAQKIQNKARKGGMDFNSYEQALEKVYEELEELEEARKTANPKAIDEEFGDLMFSVINIARFLELNAENSLTNATNKFINRFVSVEQLAFDGGRSLAQLSEGEQDALWTSIK